MNLLQHINAKVQEIFTKLSLEFDANRPLVSMSNRPDLSDFQCNEALRLAKVMGKNPREIGQMIADVLQKDTDFSAVSVDGPGFINLSVAEKVFLEFSSKMLSDKSERLGLEKVSNPKKIVIEYCSPNVAKPMHIGHIRGCAIGNSIAEIFRFAGDDVITDNHLGDWGKPLGLVITAIEEMQPDLPYFDKNFDGQYPSESPVSVRDLEEIYPKASVRSKEDEEFNNKALVALAELQNGRKGYRALWQHLYDISVEDLKNNYKVFGIKPFDTWYGEAFYNDLVKEMTTDLIEKGVAKLDDGAYIIDVKKDDDKKEMPPVLLKKSNGAMGYQSTDVATNRFRFGTLGADEAIILTDFRQGLHFEQIARVSIMTGDLKDEKDYIHLAHGTINGTDGKPFKTRDGGVMKFIDVVDMAVKKAENQLQDRDLKGADLHETARRIGTSALKFADLSNDISSSYVFDLDKFLSFEGKTGPYILYSYVRLNSILQNAEMSENQDIAKDFACDKALEKEELDLVKHFNTLSEIVEKAYKNISPHTLCDFVYELCQKFNRFYKQCSLANETDMEIKARRFAILNLCKKQIELMSDLLGLELVKAM